MNHPARLSAFLKCCGITLLLIFTTKSSAQQLYSDSAVAAMTKQNLGMLLPDSISPIVNTSGLVFDPGNISLAIETPIFVQQCGECFTYNFSHYNFSSMITSQFWSSIPAIPISVCDYRPSPPPIIECSLGAAEHPPIRANFSQLPTLAKAAENFPKMVSDLSQASSANSEF